MNAKNSTNDNGSDAEVAKTKLAKTVRNLTPGLLVCLLGTLISMGINHFVPAVSAMLFAIVLGALLANLTTIPASLESGIAFASKHLLRAGIVLLGFEVVLGDIIGLGWQMILVVILIVGLGISLTNLIGRAMGIDFKQRILIATGFSICGAAAVAGCDSVVESKKEQLATALALVVIYGTLMIPLIPALSNLIGLSPDVAGMWAGGCIHEVAQAVAAGEIIGGPDDIGLTNAVIVKLSRVVLLAPVLAVVGMMMRKHQSNTEESERSVPIIPGFVVGFLAAMTVASLNALVGWIPKPFFVVADVAQSGLLAMAMFGLGCGVKVKELVHVGWKPVLLGFIATVIVTVTAFVGVTLTH